MTAMRRLLAALAVVGVVAAPVTACSLSAPAPVPTSSKGAEEPLPDPAVLLKEAGAASKDLTSVHLTMTVTGRLESMSLRELAGDLTTEPASAAKGKAKIVVMGSGVDIDFVVFGGHLYALLPEAGWHDYGPTSSVADVVSILNPNTGLVNLLSGIIDPTAEARETIDGQQTIRIVGRVAADTANKVMPLGATKRVATTVWVQERGDHRVVQVKLAPGEDDFVQLGFSNWNVPVKVAKPARA